MQKAFSADKMAVSADIIAAPHSRQNFAVSGNFAPQKLQYAMPSLPSLYTYFKLAIISDIFYKESIPLPVPAAL